MTRPSDNQQKKRSYQIVDFPVLADHRVKLLEGEKRDKYLDLARELLKTMEHDSNGDTNCNWYTGYSHQRIDAGTGGLEIRGQVETIQMTALLKSARILRRILKTWGDLLSFRL